MECCPSCAARVLEPPGDQGGELYEHVFFEFAVLHASFDRRDHLVGVEASPAVAGDVMQLTPPEHVAHLGLRHAHNARDLRRGERCAVRFESHPVDHHMWPVNSPIDGRRIVGDSGRRVLGSVRWHTHEC